ncbi:MAG TPA: hypothetical protein VLZ81_08745, partial [Blastocatellia bacterium]|nr:hypothetical protein [Blastocatellia bacterium]
MTGSLFLTLALVFACPTIATAQWIPLPISKDQSGAAGVSQTTASPQGAARPVMGDAQTAGSGAQTNQPPGFLTRDDAVKLALAEASAYQQAQFDERIASEEVRQA